MRSSSGDYLAVGEQMIQRLSERVPELRDVLPVAEIGDLEDGDRLRSPMAYVAYGGDVAVTSSATGAAVKARQVWYAVLAVRNVRPTAGAVGDSHREAGPLISKMIGALTGWQPAAARAAMTRVTGPAPSYLAKFSLYPLQFEVDAMVQLATGE
jgi:hypothetical protein